VETGVELTVSAQTSTSSKAQTDPFKVNEGETKTGIDLVLMPAGSISFTLEGAEGGVGTLVSARYLGEGDVETKREFSRSANGSMSGLQPGIWEVTAQPMGGGGPGTESAPVEVEVLAGQEAEVVIQF
jgi:hypothetical protein